MQEYVDNGYCERIDESVVQREIGSQWFIRPLAVKHPRKGKVRCVWGLHCKCEGVSLNDKVNTGPNLLNRSLDMLVRWRQDRIALMSMFNQIVVPPEDVEYYYYRNFLSVNNYMYETG